MGCSLACRLELILRRLRCVALAAGTFIGFASVSSAADMPTKAPVYKAEPAGAAPRWAGWYVGLNAGGGWANNGRIDNIATSSFCNPMVVGCPAFDPVAAVPGNFDSHPSGFVGGGQIGYNSQTGRIVWGVEADFQGASVKGGGTQTVTVVPPGFPANTLTIAGSASQKLNSLGTLRGRLGWTSSNPWLLYVTGGLAYGHVETSAAFSDNVGGGCACGLSPFSAASNDQWRGGWTAGGGLEWMLSQHWTIRGEYLYYDLGNVTVNNTITQLNIAAVPFFGVGISSQAHFNGSIARAAANYKF